MCVSDIFFHDSTPVETTQVYLHRGAYPSPNVPTAKCTEERIASECCRVWTPDTFCCLETYPAFCPRLLHLEKKAKEITKITTNLGYGHTLLSFASPCSRPLDRCLCNTHSRAGPACKERNQTASNAWLCRELAPPLAIFNQFLYSKCHLVHDESQSFDGQTKSSESLEKVWMKRTWSVMRGVRNSVRAERLADPRVEKSQLLCGWCCSILNLFLS